MVKLKFNQVVIFLVLLVSACSGSQTGYYSGDNRVRPSSAFLNEFTVPGQTTAVDMVRSVQLYRNSPGQAPILQLGSGQNLTLRFDDLNSELDQFRVEITHHNSDWSDSGLLPNFFLQGFHTDTFGGGNKSRSQNPSYLTYTYTFPNSQMRVTRSGNFMMHVYRQHNNQKLFSMPFFVHENTGESVISMEELFNQDARYLRHHQLFVNYRYEDTSIIPQSDLRVFFVQNQFWGQARRADREDYSEHFNARLYLSRDRAFIGAYEFFDLGLGNIDQYSQQIVDFDFGGSSIPSVSLNRDVINLNIAPTNRGSRLNSSPSSNYEARYALVRFNLEIPAAEFPNGSIYLVGGFNNWSINPSNQMYFDATTGLFSGEAIVKEGTYAYKYVVLEGNRVNDTILDAWFASTRHEYHVLVYLRDNTFHYDKLVSTSVMISD